MTSSSDLTNDPNGIIAGQNSGQNPSRAEVDQAVDSIIHSGVLGKSERRAQLLRYLIEMEMTGRGGEVKAFSIAVDVLDRDATFDPNTDSIVRSEIGRLRDALRLYFAEISETDEVRIEIPKGTYRPAITASEIEDTIVRPQVSKRIIGFGLIAVVLSLALVAVFANFTSEQTPDSNSEGSLSNLPYKVVRIAVAPFQGEGANPNAEKLAFGVYSELSLSLSAYPWVSVVAPIGGLSALEQQQVDYVLIGDVYWEGDTILTSAKLVQTTDEKVVWGNSQTLTAEPEAIRTSVTDVASQIAFQLGSIDGVSPELAKARNIHSTPENLNAFVCFLGLYRYLDTPTEQRHFELRECLLDAVTEFPDFGDGWAALALIYIDEARFYQNQRPATAAWYDAKTAIDQALKYAPLRMPTLNVSLIHSIEAPEQDLDEFRRLAALLIQLFPHHPMTLNNVGSRMAEFDGEWEQGLDLIAQATYLTPAPPSAFFVTKAYHTMMWGNDAELLLSVEPLTTTTSISQLLLKYLAVARNEMLVETNEYRVLLNQQGLFENEDIVQHVLDRRYVPDLEAALLQHLEHAFSKEALQ